jgi:hypothetical protein
MLLLDGDEIIRVDIVVRSPRNVLRTGSQISGTADASATAASSTMMAVVILRDCSRSAFLLSAGALELVSATKDVD